MTTQRVYRMPLITSPWDLTPSELTALPQRSSTPSSSPCPLWGWRDTNRTGMGAVGCADPPIISEPGLAPWLSVPAVEPIRRPGLGDDGRPPPHWRDSWRSCSVGCSRPSTAPSVFPPPPPAAAAAALGSSNLRLHWGKPPGWCSPESGAWCPEGVCVG